MERMDCMEFIYQVFGSIFEVFSKRNLKTDVTFGKMNVTLVFFVGGVWMTGKWGVGDDICLWEKMEISCRV